MTTQTPSIVIPTSRRGSGRRRLLGLTGAAIIAVAAGAGLWQVERTSDTTNTVPQPAAALERPPMDESAETTQMLYVVGSQAQADAIRAALAEANAIRAHLGALPLADQVAVVAEAEAAAFFRMIDGQDAVRANLGLPSMVVVDLRPQPSTAVALPADTRGGLAELIHEGGAPASLGVPTQTSGARGDCTTTVGPTVC